MPTNTNKVVHVKKKSKAIFVGIAFLSTIPNPKEIFVIRLTYT
jgi:hypothetical protein